MIEKRFTGFSQKQGIVEGYAVKWGRGAHIPQLGRREVFLKDSLKPAAVVAMFAQHNPDSVLGTTKGKTLEIESDDFGLRFKCVLPKSAVATRELLERGDLSGASVGFSCRKDEIVDGERQIKEAELSEISLVHAPCYETEIQYRRQAQRRWKWTDLL